MVRLLLLCCWGAVAVVAVACRLLLLFAAVLRSVLHYTTLHYTVLYCIGLLSPVVPCPESESEL